MVPAGTYNLPAVCNGAQNVTSIEALADRAHCLAKTCVRLGLAPSVVIAHVTRHGAAEKSFDIRKSCARLTSPLSAPAAFAVRHQYLETRDLLAFV